jgi:hypothetical protein
VTSRRAIRLAGVVAVLASVVAPEAVAGPAAPQAADEERADRSWRGPDGRPLPFASDDELLDFLRTADVVESEEIPVGITKPLKLVLERDGVRARAAFRYEELDRKDVSIEGRHYRRFRDSCRFECAAYRLARMLGLDRVPPTADRKFQGRSGSVQIWVEGSLDEEGKDFRPPNPLAYVQETWDQDFFDNLVFNVDRNSTNIIVDERYKLWLIDHTRAFQPVPELLDPERVTRINRTMWTRLTEMDGDALKEALGPYLDGEEIMCLARRRELLLEHVEALVAERGEGVFY